MEAAEGEDAGLKARRYKGEERLASEGEPCKEKSKRRTSLKARR